MELFTATDVDQLIPQLEFFIERLQRADRDLRAQISRILGEESALGGEKNAARLLETHPGLRSLAEELQRCVQEINACGGQLKDTELGLVDFPAEMNGTLVLLCWQYGEKHVAYYHPMDSGFSARQPLDGAADRSRGFLQ